MEDNDENRSSLAFAIFGRADDFQFDRQGRRFCAAIVKEKSTYLLFSITCSACQASILG